MTSDYNEKLEELRTELDQLRERLALEDRDSKHLRDTLSEKEAIMSTLKAELEDSKEEQGRLRNRLEDLRDSSTITEKQLIEQTMLKDQSIRDSERLSDQLEG